MLFCPRYEKISNIWKILIKTSKKNFLNMADLFQKSSNTSLIKLLSTYENETYEPTIFLKSQYYNCSDFIRLLKTKSKVMKVLSLNCQSLNAKFDLLQIFLEQCNTQESQIDIICLQETWFTADCDISLYKIPGYSLVSSGKLCSEHGGVAMYIRDNIQFRILESSVKSNVFDGQFIEISFKDTCKHSRKLIMGNIYRPPHKTTDNIKLFMNELNSILHRIGRYKNIILSGDYNIDLLKCEENNVTNNFLDFIIGNSLIPRITLPTRFGKTTGTLIDNFFLKTSDEYSCTTAGIIRSHISDHLPYFITLDYFENTKPNKSCRGNKLIKISTQNFKSMTEFKCDLQKNKAELENILSDNPDSSYYKFSKIIQTLSDRHFPVKYEKFSKYKHKINKWVTDGILNSIKHRDKLYVSLKSTSTDQKGYEAKRLKFQTYNRILKCCIRTAKRNYYHNKLELVKNDIRKTWTTINEIMNRNRQKNELPHEFLINNELVSDKSIIANKFNKFFTDIGTTLSKKIDIPTDKSYKDYLNDPTQQRFEFHYIDNDTIIKIIDSLKSKHSTGHDGMSCKLLKYVKYELADPLKLLINQTFKMSMFPTSLKIARIKPIHKKDDTNIFDNYRPISILPSISKVFERIMHNQIYNYFNENKLFYASQYGFRHRHSTELASLELVQKIITSMDKNELPLNIYLDLSKAFDSLNHEILLYKLSYYGFRGKSLDLMKNYLCSRKQYVDLDDTKSDLLEIKCGVPQGSIIGPLMFIIYVNDISSVTKHFHSIVYADDTTLMTSINSSIGYNDIQMKLNKELKEINDWLKTNKLSLNIKKTKCMIFHTPQKNMRNITLPKLFIDNIQLEFVDQFNFLGIIIDKHLTWKSHVDMVAKKLSKTIGIMHKLRNTLPYYSLKTIYNSLILPYLNYGLTIWGWRSDRLFSLQKRAIRVIANLGYVAHTSFAFKQLKILKLSDLCLLHQYKFCFKLKNNLLPEYFYLVPILNAVTHNYSTRQNQKYCTPAVNHEFAKNGIHSVIPHSYNDMPKNISDKIGTHSMNGFRNYVKHFFIDNYPSECTIRNCFICGFHPPKL